MTYYLFSDSSYQRVLSKRSIAGHLYSPEGDLIACYYQLSPTHEMPVYNETESILNGMKLALDMGVTQLQVFTDDLNVTQDFHNLKLGKKLKSANPFYSELMHLGAQFESFHIEYCHEAQHNMGMVDKLSKQYYQSYLGENTLRLNLEKFTIRKKNDKKRKKYHTFV
jgi:ribonuclease HI